MNAFYEPELMEMKINMIIKWRCMRATFFCRCIARITCGRAHTHKNTHTKRDAHAGRDSMISVSSYVFFFLFRRCRSFVCLFVSFGALFIAAHTSAVWPHALTHIRNVFSPLFLSAFALCTLVVRRASVWCQWYPLLTIESNKNKSECAYRRRRCWLLLPLRSTTTTVIVLGTVKIILCITLYENEILCIWYAVAVVSM